ncbi:crotonase/enoyl-CoA hydratase family protein [Oryzibacter oryziterrae]|uniref:crotonase/enoyl-CoA hydratase family protein n=1 Tax=Oryzibacter oryziterrae TaxID=2766474 RepID=UPI001F4919EE|nr:crotonase/enoyl-CoA hydratase family protein [Oryzibacter oryziterrae]
MPSAALPETLEVTRDEAVAILKLNRPEKRNALDDDTIEGIRAFFAGLGPDVRAVVVHGAGAHFCAGLDLGEISGAPDILRSIRHSRMWHKAFDEIQYAPVPVFAALHGAVVGGGLELAAATHVRIAESSAYYALPEGQRGIFVGGGGSVRVPRLVGVPLMQDMMLTGRTISARDGLMFGFSQYVVDDGAALPKAMELAHKAAGNAPATNFAVLHALPRIAEMGPEEGLFTESLMAAIADTHPDAQERLRAFLEKRAAKVTHRE